MSGKKAIWQKVAAVFHEKAAEYDQWYEESLPFQIELQTLQELRTVLSSPQLEVGVGPGRFAAALQIGFGVDPAFSPLKIAAGRGVLPCQAVGEALPVKSGRIKTIFLLFTLCFLESPKKVLAECYRVLPAGGHIVLGFINAASSWGQQLLDKKKQGHAFYRHARLRDRDVVLVWLAEAGFSVVESRSALFQKPSELRALENSQTGLLADAGFWVIVAQKR